MSVIDSVDHQSFPRFSASAGAGLKHQHARDIIHAKLPIGCGKLAGGPPHDLLMKIRADRSLGPAPSIHYLADVAEFEMLRGRAYHAADATRA